MESKFYTGQGKMHMERVKDLPAPRRTQWLAPDKYIPDEGLVDAANVALILGQPLLLTGEPGTGKTQFAYSLSWELGLGDPLKFETKSTSSARDLFYTYDALKRFQDIQSEVASDNILPYITYQALGLAILRTKKPDEIKNLVDVHFDSSIKPSRSVVLIDEIDKAPRDFPNDILNEIENMYFRIPEIGNVSVEANKDLPPVVIITSNSEKDLPDAFLRRCVYYNIPFPKKDALLAIVSNRLGSYVGGANAFLDDALDLFYTLRDAPGGLRKNPSTSEMLGWIIAMKDIAPDEKNPLTNLDLANKTLSNLIKTTTDLDKARNVVEKWISDRKK